MFYRIQNNICFSLFLFYFSIYFHNCLIQKRIFSFFFLNLTIQLYMCFKFDLFVVVSLFLIHKKLIKENFVFKFVFYFKVKHFFFKHISITYNLFI